MTYRFFPCFVFPGEALLFAAVEVAHEFCREMIWMKIDDFLSRYPLSPFLNNCLWWLTVLSLQVGGKAQELQTNSFSSSPSIFYVLVRSPRTKDLSSWVWLFLSLSLWNINARYPATLFLA